VLQVFSDIKASNNFIIVFTVLLLRLFFLLGPFESFAFQIHPTDYVGWVFSLLNSSKWLSFFLSTSLVAFSALLLNQLVINHEVLFKRNYYAAYFYGLLCSLFPEYVYVSPGLVINFFMILAMSKLFELYKAPHPTDAIFLASLLCGLTLLFSPSYSIMLVYLLLGLLFFRNFHHREFLAALLGFVLPVFMGITLNYIVNGVFVPAYVSFPNFEIRNIAGYLMYSPLSIVFVITVMASLRVLRNFWRNTIKTRRIIQLLYVYLVLTGFLLFTGKEEPLQESVLLIVPLAIIMAHFFTTDTKLPLYKKVFHVLLLLSVIGFQFRFVFSYL